VALRACLCGCDHVVVTGHKERSRGKDRPVTETTWSSFLSFFFFSFFLPAHQSMGVSGEERKRKRLSLHNHCSCNCRNNDVGESKKERVGPRDSAQTCMPFNLTELTITGTY